MLWRLYRETRISRAKAVHITNACTSHATSSSTALHSAQIHFGTQRVARLFCASWVPATGIRRTEMALDRDQFWNDLGGQSTPSLLFCPWHDLAWHFSRTLDGYGWLICGQRLKSLEAPNRSKGPEFGDANWHVWLPNPTTTRNELQTSRLDEKIPRFRDVHIGEHHASTCWSHLKNTQKIANVEVS